MKIAIGSDHAGYDYRLMLIEHLRAQGHEVVDCGCPDKNKIGCNFCFRAVDLPSPSGSSNPVARCSLATNFAAGKISSSAPLPPAVTYVHVSSLDGRGASLACGLSRRSAPLPTLSISPTM